MTDEKRKVYEQLIEMLVKKINNNKSNMRNRISNEIVQVIFLESKVQHYDELNIILHELSEDFSLCDYYREQKIIIDSEVREATDKEIGQILYANRIALDILHLSSKPIGNEKMYKQYLAITNKILKNKYNFIIECPKLVINFIEPYISELETEEYKNLLLEALENYEWLM